MRQLLLVLLVLLCAAVPAFSHDPTFVNHGQGWSGPHYDGTANSSHPENLCASYSSLACVVAATHSFGYPVQKRSITVTNSAGANSTFQTNNKNTKGWIVVIGATGLSWGFTPLPGSENSILCSMFSPGWAGGVASLSWSTGRYYEAIFGGSYAGFVCAGL